MSVCVFEPLAGTRNRVDWRLLFKEHIAKIAKLRNPFFWKALTNFEF